MALKWPLWMKFWGTVKGRTVTNEHASALSIPTFNAWMNQIWSRVWYFLCTLLKIPKMPACSARLENIIQAFRSTLVKEWYLSRCPEKALSPKTAGIVKIKPHERLERLFGHAFSFSSFQRNSAILFNFCCCVTVFHVLRVMIFLTLYCILLYSLHFKINNLQVSCGFSSMLGPLGHCRSSFPQLPLVVFYSAFQRKEGCYSLPETD